MTYHLISIILPVFNGEKYLHDAIASCLDQTYSNIELIIINDCSTDQSLQIAKKFQEKDNRIKIISNSNNKKLPASLNVGHKMAQGDFITWTSHDNIFHPEAIAMMYTTLSNNKVDVVYSNYLIIDGEGRLKNYINLKSIEYSFFYGVVGACFLYTKEFYRKNGEYNEDLFLIEDFDFWLRGLKHAKFYKIENPGFYFYRYHEAALTSKIQNDSKFSEEFHERLTVSYRQLFFQKESCGSDSGVYVYFINYLNGNQRTKMIPLINKSFFKELKSTVINYKGISYLKLKRIIVNDCIEVILNNKEFQNIRVLTNLHFLSGSELLRLPVKRYLVICRKCLF
jgi:glycosyltransferase involved in cell wall biosynthesis